MSLKCRKVATPALEANISCRATNFSDALINLVIGSSDRAFYNAKNFAFSIANKIHIFEETTNEVLALIASG